VEDKVVTLQINEMSLYQASLSGECDHVAYLLALCVLLVELSNWFD
jgi:hypothetical protein